MRNMGSEGFLGGFLLHFRKFQKIFSRFQRRLIGFQMVLGALHEILRGFKGGT